MWSRKTSLVLNLSKNMSFILETCKYLRNTFKSEGKRMKTRRQEHGQKIQQQALYYQNKKMSACRAASCLLTFVSTLSSAQNTLPTDVHLVKFLSPSNLCSNLIFSMRLTLTTDKIKDNLGNFLGRQTQFSHTSEA